MLNLVFNVYAHLLQSSFRFFVDRLSFDVSNICCHLQRSVKCKTHMVLKGDSCNLYDVLDCCKMYKKCNALNSKLYKDIFKGFTVKDFSYFIQKLKYYNADIMVKHKRNMIVIGWNWIAYNIVYFSDNGPECNIITTILTFPWKGCPLCCPPTKKMRRLKATQFTMPTWKVIGIMSNPIQRMMLFIWVS